MTLDWLIRPLGSLKPMTAIRILIMSFILVPYYPGRSGETGPELNLKTLVRLARSTLTSSGRLDTSLLCEVLGVAFQRRALVELSHQYCRQLSSAMPIAGIWCPPCSASSPRHRTFPSTPIILGTSPCSSPYHGQPQRRLDYERPGVAPVTPTVPDVHGHEMMYAWILHHEGTVVKQNSHPPLLNLS